MAEAISKKDLTSYGMLAMPLAFAGIPLYIHAPDFYATEFGISLGSLGFVLLALRFIDAIQDPAIGYFSDKYSKYRPMIMPIAAILLVVGFTLLFQPLSGYHLVWFAIFVLLATTAFSILTINLNTLGGLWSRDKNQRTTIAGFREAFGLIGLILAVILPSILQSNMPKAQVFEYVSLLLAAIMLISIIAFWFWQRKPSSLHINRKTQPFSLRHFSTLSNHTKRFFCVYGISMLASSIPAVLVLFFIRDRLDLESYAGLFLLAYFLSGAVGIPIWQRLSCKIGKYNAWAFAMALAVVSFIWAYFLDVGDLGQYVAICVLSGVAFGAELVLPASILADHIHGNKKENQASFHYGVLAFLAKLSLAMAAAISFAFLDMSGFTPAADNTDNALQALSLSYAAIPCFIKLISTYLLWRLINDKTINNTNRSSNYA